MKHFELSDAQKFEEVWQMKEQDVQQLLSILLTADKVISEQQLGFLWFPPSHDALQRKFEEGKRRALAAGKKRADAGVGEDDIMQLTAASSERVQEVRSMARLLHVMLAVPHARAQVLKLLVDESGYLMDSKAITLFPPQPVSHAAAVQLTHSAGAAPGGAGGGRRKRHARAGRRRAARCRCHVMGFTLVPVPAHAMRLQVW